MRRPHKTLYARDQRPSSPRSLHRHTCSTCDSLR
ncbi:hypothetical protein AK812_SmicGene46124, partial [Symbiodinium microadriaticum]